MPGLWYEEFQVGDVIQHPRTHKITQEDNAAFCHLSQNRQPLHLDETYAAKTPFGRIVVNGLYTMAVSVGISVDDLTDGTLVVNLGYYEVEHPKPVFPGDTIRVTSEVLDKRETSKPGRGIVTVQHRVYNQDDVEVCRYQRRVMVQMQPDQQEALPQ